MNNDLISRQAVIDYLDRTYNSGMGKKKSHEYITKFVSKLPPAMTADEIAKYHKEHGEVVVTTDVWEDAKKALERVKTSYCINIPAGATNGDVIKAIFPNREVYDGYTNTYYGELRIDKSFWEAPYKAGEEK